MSHLKLLRQQGLHPYTNDILTWFDRCRFVAFIDYGQLNCCCRSLKHPQPQPPWQLLYHTWGWLIMQPSLIWWLFQTGTYWLPMIPILFSVEDSRLVWSWILQLLQYRYITLFYSLYWANLPFCNISQPIYSGQMIQYHPVFIHRLLYAQIDGLW